MRFMVSNEGNISSGGVTYKLQFAETDTCGQGAYTDVATDDSGPFKIVNSFYLIDGQITTDVPSGLTNEADTFVAGQVKDTGNITSGVTLEVNQFTELEFVIAATENLNVDSNYCFRLVGGGGTISSYSVYGQIELSSCDVDLTDHTAGQETDKFTVASSVTGAELFAFQLTNNNVGSGVTVDQVQFQLSGVTGIAQSDFANLAIYVDANNDGTIGTGETTTVGGTGVVSSGVTEITFSTDFTIPASTSVNYILKGDVSNIAPLDTVTISLGDFSVELVSGTVGFSTVTDVTHFAEADSVLTQIHTRWRNDDGGDGLFGSGADGSATLSASKNINTDVIGSNRSTYADGIVTTVTTDPQGNAIGVSSANGFAAGDEILLINMQGTSGASEYVGNYEFLGIASVSGTTLYLTSGVSNTYGGANFASQKVVVQRVPQWTDVTISSGVSLTANAWDGTSGGIIVFRAMGTVNVASGATIVATGLGYRGGDRRDDRRRHQRRKL